MPRTPKNPIIVATFDGRTIGWSGGETCRVTGDDEWVAVARAASTAKLEFTLYESIDLKADLDDADNPLGAFAAMAWFAKERIRVKQAPEGMMESLGLYSEPLTVEVTEGLTDEEREFQSTHLALMVDGKKQWIPLKNLQNNQAAVPQVFMDTLRDLGVGMEEPGKDIS